MDGASKFVKGDAIANIVIVIINIIFGLIIGMVQMDMSFSRSDDTFTRLTVGDRLVNQIPALLLRPRQDLSSQVSTDGNLSSDITANYCNIHDYYLLQQQQFFCSDLHRSTFS